MKLIEFARMSTLQVKCVYTSRIASEWLNRWSMVDQVLYIWLIFSTWQADNHRQMFRLSDSKMNLEFPSGQPLVSSPAFFTSSNHAVNLGWHVANSFHHFMALRHSHLQSFFTPPPRVAVRRRASPLAIRGGGLANDWRRLCITCTVYENTKSLLLAWPEVLQNPSQGHHVHRVIQLTKTLRSLWLIMRLCLQMYSLRLEAHRSTVVFHTMIHFPKNSRPATRRSDPVAILI